MTGNIYMKLTALALAFIVWLYVSAGDNHTDKLIPIPLVLHGLPDGLALVTVVPDQVELYVSGPLSRIRQLEEAQKGGELKAVFDLRRAKEGKKAYRIRVAGANLRWLFHETHPGPSLEVEIEPKAKVTTVPERLIIGDLDPGAYIEMESGLPDEVTVSGANSLIEKLDKVVYRLTEADLVGFESITVEFIPKDANGRHIFNLVVTPPSADIDIEVRKSGAAREVPVVYNLVGSPPSGYTVTDVKFDPLFITLEGPSEILKNITRVETEPIDLNGHDSDFTIPTLQLVQPDERVKLTRSTVILEVKIAHKTAQRRFEGLSIRWEGGKDLVLHYSPEPRLVNVTVAGPLGAINQLDRNMIAPVVDVTGLAEGIHENRRVSVQISLSEISLVDVEPQRVSIRVQTREEFTIEGENE